MTTIQPMLARFAADLNDMWTKLCEEAPDEFFNTFGQVSIQLYTDDGLTAKFYEEGIDFYPEEKGNALG